ncbi:hypothetical protein CBZ_22900 [Cellulomonas biazotea]|uniref:Uncharacterized protein n=1 Tax=Cellulomonas biazotea TaxID=1709 RepID=A0A402DSY8_9CELL|nr:hypothetical protein CBZ_22900 [Cellulomonas biazotea]
MRYGTAEYATIVSDVSRTTVHPTRRPARVRRRAAGDGRRAGTGAGRAGGGTGGTEVVVMSDHARHVPGSCRYGLPPGALGRQPDPRVHRSVDAEVGTSVVAAAWWW